MSNTHRYRLKARLVLDLGATGFKDLWLPDQPATPPTRQPIHANDVEPATLRYLLPAFAGGQALFAVKHMASRPGTGMNGD